MLAEQLHFNEESVLKVSPHLQAAWLQAAARGDIDGMSALCQFYPDVAFEYITNQQGQNACLIAAQYGHSDVAALFLLSPAQQIQVGQDHQLFTLSRYFMPNSQDWVSRGVLCQISVGALDAKGRNIFFYILQYDDKVLLKHLLHLDVIDHGIRSWLSRYAKPQSEVALYLKNC